MDFNRLTAHISIRAIALDVDGVLTDGSFWWGENGEEFKRFSFADIMGISLGRKAGFVFALISGENSPLIDRYAEKMGISDVFKDCKNKAAAVDVFASRHGFEPRDICFMGDDVNDLAAMALAGLSVSPANAHASVRRAAAWVTERAGGHGAVRELVDFLLANR